MSFGDLFPALLLTAVVTIFYVGLTARIIKMRKNGGLQCLR